MLRLLIVSLFALGLVGPARAQDEAAAIEGVIGSQIEAFRADDFATAFTFASPAIQRIFRTPENFGAMVRNGYPMVWRPAEVEFRGLEGAGNLYAQQVLVRDAQGVYHLLEYQMIRIENGWRINGVSLLETPPVGV